MGEGGASADWSSLHRWRRVAATGSDEAKTDPNLFKGQWLSLAAAGIDVAAAMATASANPAAVANATIRLVKLILEAEDAQADLLSTIDSNVRLIRDGPFNTAMLHLEDAAFADGPAEARAALEHARLALYQAHSNAAEAADRALVEFHIGLVWLAQGQRNNARRFLCMSHDTIAPIVREYAEVAGVTGSRFREFSRGDWIATASLGMWYLAYKAVRDRGPRRPDERARLAAQRLYALGSTAASVHNELAPAHEHLDVDVGLSADRSTPPG